MSNASSALAEQVPNPLVAGSYLARAKGIASLVSACAAQTEREHDIAPAVITALLKAGLPWMLVPSALGGGGVWLSEALQVVEEISRADGSTGWAFMAPSFITGLHSGYMNPEGAGKLWAGPHKAIVAGMGVPVKPMEKTGSGYLIEGKFGFASGSVLATHMVCGFVAADESGSPLLDESGSPDLCLIVLPKDNVEMLGNWNVWGLVGTGSYDYAINKQFVSEDYAVRVFAPPVRDEPVFRLGALPLGVSGHAAVALGIATRALEEVATITAAKVRPGYGPSPVGESDLFRVEFGRKEALLQGARAYLYGLIRTSEEEVRGGGMLSAEAQSRIRQVTTWLQEVAAEVVGFAHRWAGSQSIKDNSALGRCVRDISIATQHALVDQKTYADAAADILPGYIHR